MVPYQEAEALVTGERYNVAGAEELGREDVIVPRVRVRQPMSKFGAPQDAGKFHNNLTEQFSETISAVVLRVSKGRVMWAEEFDGADMPLCASDDAKEPRDNIGVSDPQPGPCETCPMAQWGADHEPPRCSLVYTYLCADRHEDDMPFLISAMRTSAAAAKKLNTLVKMFGIRKEMVIKTVLRQEDKGIWYELLFQVAAPLTADEMRYYASMAASFADVKMTVDTENTAGVDDLGDDDFTPIAADAEEMSAF